MLRWPYPSVVGLLFVACASTTAHKPDSETHWLAPCADARDCGASLECLCGVCTVQCDDSCPATELSCTTAASTASCNAPGSTTPRSGKLCLSTCSGDAPCGPGSTCQAGRCESSARTEMESAGIFSSTDAGLPPEEVCYGETTRPESIVIEVPTEVDVEVPVEIEQPRPTALFFMLDRSAEMGQPGALPQSPWETATLALTDFVSSSDAGGLQVAMQYFPLDGVDYGDAAICNDPAGSPHDVPEVSLGVLPGNIDPLMNSLSNQSVADATTRPLEPALRGVVSACSEFRAQNQDWDCIAILIRGDAPNQCATDASALATIAADAKAAAGVTTFAVGFSEADLPALDLIATAGEGDCDTSAPGYQACDASSGLAALAAALVTIRESTLETVTVTRVETRVVSVTEPVPCKFAIPPPPDGEVIDPGLINLSITHPDGETVDLQRYPTPATDEDCGAGWYYEDQTAATTGILCEEACGWLEEGAQIDVVLGCQTRVAAP